jgi:hypothetical protein
MKPEEALAEILYFGQLHGYKWWKPKFWRMKWYSMEVDNEG